MLNTAASCNVKPAAMLSRASINRSVASSPTVLVVVTKSTVAVSLSVMATVRNVVPPSVSPEVGDEIVSTAVSAPSTNASSRIVNVTLPVVAPSAMVIVVAESVPSPAVIPVPLAAIATD